jgi:hypothetical protein
MGLFTKKIKKDKIVNSIMANFAVSRDLLLEGIIEFVENNTEITNEQDHEIMILALLSNIHPYKSAFENDLLSEYIVGKFQDTVFNVYLFSEKEKKDFKEKFLIRCKEYYEVYKPGNRDMAIQIGQIFCTYFFGEKEEGKHVKMMYFIGETFLVIQIENKKFIDEILSNYEVI